MLCAVGQFVLPLWNIYSRLSPSMNSCLFISIAEPAFTCKTNPERSQDVSGILLPPQSIYLSLTTIRLISLHFSLAQHAWDARSDCDQGPELQAASISLIFSPLMHGGGSERRLNKRIEGMARCNNGKVRAERRNLGGLSLTTGHAL